MKGTTKQVIGTLVLTLGVLTVFNSFEFYAVDPFWLGGVITIAGVAIGVLGWKMITRGRSDAALETARHNDAPVPGHQEGLAGDGHRPRRQDPSSEYAPGEESSLEDPPERR
ncbi:hypothetical protein [Kocuria rosea]|uniref:Uncharacterized protein n=1 Tax=Kocuria rosea TaxID=1275 RepID=A0A4R5YBV5_KOCRO|nr:hypothetical protein [Kocuria rosea]TDL42460.1 hypothetical protein E2R59_10975 [Kocuria rosea]